MQTVRAAQIRALANTLSDGGKTTVTTQMFCTALGADCIASKARVRKAVSNMVSRGELVRVKDGEFEYMPQKAAGISAYGEGYKRMWRIIRTEKSGWTMQQIAGTTRMHSTSVGYYCKFLEQEKFIVRCGKQGNTRLFRATQKAIDQRETPYPPRAPKDAYAKERNAACRIIRMFMDANPGRNKAEIITECRAIIARFEKENANVEQEN